MLLMLWKQDKGRQHHRDDDNNNSNHHDGKHHDDQEDDHLLFGCAWSLDTKKKHRWSTKRRHVTCLCFSHGHPWSSYPIQSEEGACL